MEATTNPSLCVNFRQMQELMKLTGDFDLSILYGKLKYQVKQTKLIKDGKKVIARSRRQIAAYLGKGLTVTDEKLKSLVRLGLINIKVGMWKGKKRMFVSCNGDYDLGINARKLEMMNKYTGSIHLSVLLAYFSYWIEVKPLHHDRANWAMVSRQSCADLLNLDKKTIDIYVKELADKGLIQYEVKRFFRQRQYWVTVNDDFKKKILQEYREEQEQIEEAKAEGDYFMVSEKSGVSIRINKTSKIDIINNNTKECEINASALVDENGVVILSKRQENYLSSAIKRTLARCDVLTWSYDTLMGHMRYVLGTPKKRNSATNFVHCINRAMFLVRKNLWQVPLGYLYYSDEAREAKEALLPVNPASGCVIPGSGSIMLWDYGVEDKTIPYAAEIVAERARLEGLDLPMEEVNQSLLAKFGQYGRPYLLSPRVVSQVSAIKKGWRTNRLTTEQWDELAKTDPVIRKALEGAYMGEVLLRE